MHSIIDHHQSKLDPQCTGTLSFDHEDDTFSVVGTVMCAFAVD